MTTRKTTKTTKKIQKPKPNYIPTFTDIDEQGNEIGIADVAIDETGLSSVNNFYIYVDSSIYNTSMFESKYSNGNMRLVIFEDWSIVNSLMPDIAKIAEKMFRLTALRLEIGHLRAGLDMWRIEKSQAIRKKCPFKKWSITCTVSDNGKDGFDLIEATYKPNRLTANSFVRLNCHPAKQLITNYRNEMLALAKMIFDLNVKVLTKYA